MKYRISINLNINLKNLEKKPLIKKIKIKSISQASPILIKINHFELLKLYNLRDF